jgi:NADPH-dependent curcumin reductase CurA
MSHPSTTNKQVLFKEDPGRGWVTTDHMEVVSTPLQVELKQGQLLLKNLYLSVDPYMRGRMNTSSKSYVGAFQLGKVLQGGGIGEVMESQSNHIKVGDIVSTMIGWEQYTVVSDAAVRKVDNIGVPLSYYLGVLGMPGATAYHGLLNIGEPKPGNTVFVTGAAGAVGLVVIQIAKIKGCTVIASAGSDEKVALCKSLGADHTFNYKTQSTRDALKEFAPNGIDVYFDNVGGEVLDITIEFMNVHGRLVECGMISQYNAETPYGIKNLMMVVGKQLKIQGFIISTQLADKSFMQQFAKDVVQWVTEGKLKYTETITEGIENAPSAFVGMLKGENKGKQIIKL